MNETPSRSIAALLVCSLALVGSPALAQEPAPSPDAGGGDSTAVAVNTKDDSMEFRFTFHIRRANGDIVDTQNAAVAFASCEGCQTVAISIQTVLVMSDPTIVTPGNFALAINWECMDCQTLASAYQFVLGTGGPVHFTAEGNRTIAEIRNAIRALGSGELSIVGIQAALTLLMDELRDVLANELVLAGGDSSGPTGESSEGEPAEGSPGETSDGGDQEQPEASPSPATSPEPGPTATASPTVEPSPTP